MQIMSSFAISFVDNEVADSARTLFYPVDFYGFFGAFGPSYYLKIILRLLMPKQTFLILVSHRFLHIILLSKTGGILVITLVHFLNRSVVVHL